MLEWSQRWCEEVQREPVRCGRNVLIKPTWKYVETLLVNAATVSWYATVGGIETEQTLVQECEMFRRRHEYEKSSAQTVISTTTSHKAKRDEATRCEYLSTTRAPYANER